MPRIIKGYGARGQAIQDKLYKNGKGKEAKLSYIGNVTTENRDGFVVEAELRQVSGSVEREAAAAMIVRPPRLGRNQSVIMRIGISQQLPHEGDGIGTRIDAHIVALECANESFGRSVIQRRSPANLMLFNSL